MGIIINDNTRVVVQGITGKEGSRATKDMLTLGTNVSCGVTPGKGGLKIENLPVFDSVKEAIEFDPKINTSVLYVPPLMVFNAAIEAINQGIKTIVIITEQVPLKDTAKLIELAKKNNCRIIGPSSIGVITPNKAKLGSIAGSNEKGIYTQGEIGVISKSGGMCAETSRLLTNGGLGQSTVVGIGGDILIGSTFLDLLSLFEKDEKTKAVVLFGEIGGTYEEEVVQKIKQISKPVIAFISGKFVESLNSDHSFGHTGAFIDNGKGGAENKEKVLREAGVIIADYHHQIPELVKKALNK